MVAGGGVRAPGGLPRLQSGWDGRSPSGGFDSRPPPPHRLTGPPQPHPRHRRRGPPHPTAVGCGHEEADPACHARRPRCGRGQEGALRLGLPAAAPAGPRNWGLPGGGRTDSLPVDSSPEFCFTRPGRARCSLPAGRPKGAAAPRWSPAALPRCWPGRHRRAARCSPTCPVTPAAVLGVAEPARAGPGRVAGRGGRRRPPGRSARLEVDAGAGLRLLAWRPPGPDFRPSRRAGPRRWSTRCPPTPGRWSPTAGRPTTGAGLALAAGAEISLLVLRPCYLALRRALAAPVRPSGVVLVTEHGRSLGRRDVEDVLGVPVRAEVPVEEAVARAVDAGLLARRLPRSLDRAPSAASPPACRPGRPREQPLSRRAAWSGMTACVAGDAKARIHARLLADGRRRRPGRAGGRAGRRGGAAAGRRPAPAPGRRGAGRRLRARRPRAAAGRPGGHRDHGQRPGPGVGRAPGRAGPGRRSTSTPPPSST